MKKSSPAVCSAVPRSGIQIILDGFHPLERATLFGMGIAALVCMIRLTLEGIFGQQYAERTDGVASLIVFVLCVPGLLAVGRRFSNHIRERAREIREWRENVRAN